MTKLRRREEGETHQAQFRIFAHTAESVPTSTAASTGRIERYRGDEGRMALTPRNEPLFPRRINRDQVVLPADRDESGIR